MSHIYPASFLFIWYIILHVSNIVFYLLEMCWYFPDVWFDFKLVSSWLILQSDARSSRVLRNGSLENVDQVIAKKRKALVGFDEYRKKGIKFNNSESENNHENKKWIQNLPEIRQGESSDIEEGQIVPEEYKEPSFSRRVVTEGAAPNDSVKKRMSQIDDNSDQFIGGYDSQRILDSLAKMEKRRERFKQPITKKKEAEESLKLNNDSIVDTGEMKQHRPARRRRWVGS